MAAPRNDTPFSFHCIICFEEFHPDDRYPVVLPCGHTYVCNLCAHRLDRCMECRTPLFEEIQCSKSSALQQNQQPYVVSTPANMRASWSGARGSRTTATTAPPPKTTKRRLPLPQNVVLLSLIAATELASAETRRHFVEADLDKTPVDEQRDENKGTERGDEIPNLHSMGSMLDVDSDDDDDYILDEQHKTCTHDGANTDDDDEEEKIKISTNMAVGVAGTYAVAAKDGLELFTALPTANSVSSDKDSSDDVDTLVSGYRKENSRDEDDLSLDDTPMLRYGDRVQIVSVHGGWAKLGRGYGFVRADRNQLVKVGGTVDRSCTLEAILFNISNQRKELRMQQSRVDNQFIQFMNALQHSLQTDEDLTVIHADAFSSQATMTPRVETEENMSSNNDSSGFYPQKPQPPRPNTPPLESIRRGFSCFAGNVFGDDSATTVIPPPAPEHLLRSALANHDLRNYREHTSLFPHQSQPSPSAMRAGAQAWRDSNNGINFRTGMSGHMALLSTHAHADAAAEQRPIRGMSHHAGLTAWTRIPKNIHWIFNTFGVSTDGDGLEQRGSL